MPAQSGDATGVYSSRRESCQSERNRAACGSNAQLRAAFGLRGSASPDDRGDRALPGVRLGIGDRLGAKAVVVLADELVQIVAQSRPRLGLPRRERAARRLARLARARAGNAAGRCRPSACMLRRWLRRSSGSAGSLPLAAPRRAPGAQAGQSADGASERWTGRVGRGRTAGRSRTACFERLDERVDDVAIDDGRAEHRATLSGHAPAVPVAQPAGVAQRFAQLHVGHALVDQRVNVAVAGAARQPADRAAFGLWSASSSS